ncbi:MAG TPA: protein kinase [Labilithrix sp.]|nr:protein kinase [Labilithrix sp.]
MGKFTVFGPYELRARPSIGGMAEVFHAVDTRTGTRCAIKRLLPSVAGDEEVVTMFEDEARIAATLDHPNIARVLDFGAIDEQPFIAYELVDGVDLREVFDAASMASEPQPLPFLLHVFARLGEALAHAHEREVIHRDVTPQNVVLSFDGDVKLIDFGIAKAKGKLSRTGAGRIKGKLGYLSPEQLRGGDVDARTDVFSLGICMWELLTLKRLFSSPNEILVLDMVKRLVPEPPSAHRAEVGQNLDRIVLKALAKNTDERYRSARELTKDLDAFVGKTEPLATRADIARTLRQTFGDRSTGSIMEFQETRMSDDNKSGSDLDIFEGLGKKSAGRVSAVPPPPPGSASNLPVSPSGNMQARGDMKRTLMGIPGPAQPPSQNGVPSAPPTTPSSAPVPTASASGMPAPPTSQARVSVPPPLPSQSSGSGSMRAVATPSSAPASPSKPPPPPGRGSLPNLQAQQAPGQSTTMPSTTMPSTTTLASAGNTAPSTTQKVQSQFPPPASTRPAPSSNNATPAAQPAAANASNGGKLDMDWDDEDEATHVFDKESRDEAEAAAAAAPAQGPESRRPEHASMDDILSSPRPSVPAAGMPAPAVTLTGQFGALGQPRESNGGVPSNQFRSGAPPSQSLRSAPPPPPGGGPISMRGPNPSTTTAPIPPPPPPGQTTTAPMHMPVRPNSAPPPSMPPMQQQAQGQMPQMQGPHSVPPQQQQQQYPSQGPHSQPHQQISQPPMPQMPPVSRAMEATAVVPRQQQGGKAGLIIALIVGVFAAMAIAGFFLMPRTGTLVVNVADAKGGAVSKIEIIVDDKKACDSAPCIVRDVQSGVHQVKVVAQGFEPPAPRAVTVEARKDSSIDFSLSPSAGGARSAGTGVKVSGTQNGVKLLVDGKEYGLLPQEIHDLAPGEHKVKIVGSERYAPLEKTIEVKQDELTDLGSVALKVLKGKATIQLGTPGAKVYLVNGTNRKEVPQFPIAIDFDPNEKWQLEGKMLGMEDYSSPISFDDGQAEKTIVVTLSPKGTMPAMTPAPGTRPPPTFVAPTPPTPKEPGTAAAPHPVAPTPPTPKEPTAAAGGEAFLNINSRPASTVLLDGKPLGPTPRVKVSVTPGTHTVLFVNAEESLKKSVSITVAAGETKAVSAKLRD